MFSPQLMPQAGAGMHAVRDVLLKSFNAGKKVQEIKDIEALNTIQTTKSARALDSLLTRSLQAPPPLPRGGGGGLGKKLTSKASTSKASTKKETKRR